MTRILWTVALAFAAAGTLKADDWPQWMGPDRDGVWRETGILDQFPEGGPKIQWRVPLAGGYAGPAVVGGKVFVTDYVREAGNPAPNPSIRNTLKGRERVRCLDAATGQLLWEHEYNCPYAISYPAGPRCTPAVDGDRVYTLGAEGHLICLSVNDGKVIWSRELKKDYDTEAPLWGFAAHPLIDGDKLICVVGGSGSVAVAFDKRTGREIWKALDAKEPGYCPPSIVQAGGVRQLIIWHAEAVNGLDPETGQLYWSVPLEPKYGMSIMAPRRSGPYLFASGIGEVGALLKLADDKPAAEVVWRGTRKDAVYCANSTPHIDGDTLYGFCCMQGQLRGVRLDTGERLWETFEPIGGKRGPHGTGFLVKNGGRYFIFSETGQLLIAKLTPTGYQQIGAAKLLEPTGDCFGRQVVWSHPAFADKSIFARNDKEIVRASLAAQ